MAVELVFLLLSLASATAGRNLVSSLPGYDGALPSLLETGYVSVDDDNGAELFYYFIESEANPRRDPVLLWLTGGDRCSVFCGLAFEIGPVKFITEPYYGGLPRLEYNPYAWTKAANILFVDSPVGAGFSFSRDPRGYDVGDVSSSLQLVRFLRTVWRLEIGETEMLIFCGSKSTRISLATLSTLEGIPTLGRSFRTWCTRSQKRSLIHATTRLAADWCMSLSNAITLIGACPCPSCGWRCSNVCSAFSDIEAKVRPALNLKGYLVGNPLTYESIDNYFRVPYAHGVGIISDQLYETIMEHCQGQDYTNPENLVCAQSMMRFNDLIDEVSIQHILYPKCIYVSPGQNGEPERRRIIKEKIQGLKHPPPRVPMDCQNYKHYLLYFWANNIVTQDALGIKKGTKDEWLRCHDGDLPYSKDIKSSILYHRNVILKGYRALVYSGDHDLVVPFLGTQAWVRSLNFSIVDDWRAWHLDGQSAGFTIAYANNLTFATVKGGGHTAPAFEPERCFTMFRRWISNKPL